MSNSNAKAAELISIYQALTTQQKEQFFALISQDAALPANVRELADEAHQEMQDYAQNPESGELI